MEVSSAIIVFILDNRRLYREEDFSLSVFECITVSEVMDINFPVSD